MNLLASLQEQGIKQLLTEAFSVDILHVCDYLCINSCQGSNLDSKWNVIWTDENGRYSHFLAVNTDQVKYGFIDSEEPDKQICRDFHKVNLEEALKEVSKLRRLNKSMNNSIDFYKGFSQALLREPAESVFLRYEPADVLKPLVDAYNKNEASAINCMIMIKHLQLISWELEIENLLRYRIEKDNATLLVDLKKLHADIKVMSIDYAKIVSIRNSMIKKFPKDVTEYYDNLKYIESVEKKIKILRKNLDIVSNKKRKIENECNRYATFIDEKDFFPENYYETQEKWEELISDYKNMT